MIGFIVGSGSENKFDGDMKKIDTPFGVAEVFVGENVAILSRHGKDHEYLPHQINYRANLWALKEVGCAAIVSFSVVGVLNADLKLGEPYMINDLYYPSNRLPNGEACTIFAQPGEKGRGHLIAGSLFNESLNSALKDVLPYAGRANYVYSIGPRFNTKMEIGAFRSAGSDLISQTCGPEAVLANELEMPFAIVAFAIDYANGVSEVPTSIEELNGNLAKSADVFEKVIEEFSQKMAEIQFENFVYRFE